MIFLDTKRNMALVLNPVDMTFIQPLDTKLIQDSSHLRVLVFSDETINQLEIQIDDENIVKLSQSSPNTPLYTGL